MQDSVAFTGSAHTAGILRQHPSVLHGGVTLQVEADSLNCSVLGPDVTSSDPEWDLFVKGVVTEMTAKAGQKCTAIRRVIVPAAVADEMTEAIAAKLATITVGNPGDESVRMGPLASLGQREEVRKAVEALRSSADVVLRRPDARPPASRATPSVAPSCRRCCSGPAPAPSSRTTWSPSARCRR